MKQELEEIYRALADGRISKEAALQRISALRGAARADTLLASAEWEPEGIVRDAPASGEARHVLLCGFPAGDAEAVATHILAPPAAHTCAVLPSTAGDDVGTAYTQLALALFGMVQRLLAAKPRMPMLVQWVVAGDDDAHWCAGLAGLMETARIENPLLRGQILFVGGHAQPADIAQRIRDEWHTSRDTVVRYADGGRFVRRWQVIDAVVAASADAGPGLAEQPHRTDVPVPLKESGVYLIVGGAGGLGRLFAQQMLGDDARARVILASRRTPDEASLAALRALGHVECCALDVTDFTQVDALVRAVLREHGQLNGVVHSAGLLRDDFIVRKQADAFAEVLAPKVAGTVNLDRATQALDLDFMLLFSSVAAWAGNVGQADYAAANGFVEQFAGYRSRLVAAGERRGQTLAIAWPHWLDGGMQIDAASMEALHRRTGLRSLPTETGMRASRRAMMRDRAQWMVMHGERAALERALLPVLDTRTGTVPQITTVASRDDLHVLTRVFLRDELAPVLKLPAERIDPRAPLEQYGIDSIVAMSLTSRLEATFGTLAKTLFFEYQTLDELAGYFVQAHSATLAEHFAAAAAPTASQTDGTPSAEPAAPLATPNARRARRRMPAKPLRGEPRPYDEPIEAIEPIAIVGLSGRYPQAPDLNAYWRNLSEGRDCIVEIPRERWDWREYYQAQRPRDGAHHSRWGGFIDGVDEFDPRFFNIAPRDAAAIDPQERLFLQHAWMAIEDAGYTRASLQIPHAFDLPGQVGVYAGVMYGEYNLSGSLAGIANRVSYFLNLHGPSLTLDSMCSSSLTALHLASQDLRSGRTSLAIAGGVNVSIHPNKYTALSAGQFLSGDGHCQSFGEGGDGYIPGEGVGVAVLKRLADAERDGNHIYGVIRGSALNHGGKTNGYTVPNPRAQADVIRMAMAQAGVDPRHVSYVEAHGTGTRLGDPIEIAALAKVFEGAAAPRIGVCRIGSAKSNIGHCESAAGIAGVTKVLLQMKHRVIVPSLHSRRLNPNIDFDATPFVVNQTLTEWTQLVDDGRRVPRMAGVSSFGAGGSNAHLIVEEYDAPVRPLPMARGVSDQLSHEPIIVPLSARTAEQLLQRARDLLAFLEGHADVDPVAFAYTLQVGREAMDERIAFVSDTLGGLRAQLHAFAAGGELPGQSFRGQPHQYDAPADSARVADVERELAARALPTLARSWAAGAAVDWGRLYAPDSRPGLISLPTYPFARERHWIAPMRAARTPATLHPLVHTNTSDLHAQRYTSRFTGDEAFVDADAEMPALLVLEQMRFALASAAHADGPGWDIIDLRWGEAVIAAQKRALHTVLFARESDRIDIEIHSVDDAGREHVHAQAHARAARMPVAIDSAHLHVDHRSSYAGSLPEGVTRAGYSDGDGQWLLAELAARPRLRPAEEAARWGLHPDLLKQLNALLVMSIGAPVAPMSLDSVYIAREGEGDGDGASAAMIRLRTDVDSRVDIDVSDIHGNVCLRLRGLCLQIAERQAAAAVSDDDCVSLGDEASVTVAEAGSTVAPRELMVEPSHAPVKPVFRGKPVDVVLAPAAAAAVTVTESTTITPAKISLAPADPASANPEPTAVALFDLGGGVFRIDIRTAALSTSVGPLARALDFVQREASLRTLLLADASGQGWYGARAVCDALVEQRVLAALCAFPCPVVVLAPFGAAGAGWLLSLVGDFMVLGDESGYGYTDAASGLIPELAEDQLFRARLGDVLADDCLYRAHTLRGRQLRERGWTCRIAPSGEAPEDAMQLARLLARKAPLAARLLAGHLRRNVAAAVAALAPAAASFDAIAMPSAGPIAEAAAPILVTNDAIDASALAHGAWVVELGAGSHAYDIATLNVELKTAFEHARGLPDCRSIVLTSVDVDRLNTAARASDETSVRSLLDTLLRCPLPLVAAFEAGAEGIAWVLSLACDTTVYRADACYGVAGLDAWPQLAQDAAALGVMRIGAELSRQLSFAAERWSGGELHARNRVLPVAASGEVLPCALMLADCWRQWPAARVRAWKAGQAARLRALLDAARAAARSTTQSADADLAALTDAAVQVQVQVQVPLRSTVVSASEHADGVILVTMHERDAKNLFTTALVDGLHEAFAYAGAHPACKAVVLTGFDSYFATGGTRDALIALHAGDARFTDERVFQLPMDCPVPVIVAMQGHAIGAGWSFGMFGDLAILSDESQYVSPYIDYGFTPGAGSTLVFPDRIGLDLARETLLAGAGLSGAALRARGVALPILPSRDVLAFALELAHRIAQQPRARLVQLKRLFTHALRHARDGAYARELEMHEATFVRNPEVLARIEERFAPGSAPAQKSSAAADAQAPADDATASNGDTTETTVADVVATLRMLLARELHLEPGEIGERTSFVSLGLDSVSGVTWVRRINEHYGINIEATRIYSHPTLAEIAEAVMQAALAAGALRTAPRATPSIVPGTQPAAASKTAFAPPPHARTVLSSWRRAAAREPGRTGLTEPVAVIGMAGQFPKAPDVETFWRNVAEGLDCIEEVPNARWRVRDYFQPGAPTPGKTYNRWLGALDGYDCFDPLFFNLSPAEAECMEPQQRLFMQCVWHCIENAGYAAQRLSGSACGVFVGCATSDYHQGADEARLSAQGFTGAATSILAARIAYFLDLHGPSLAIDTACSSSLVALAHACDSLNAGHCDVALAGGVYVMAGPSMHVMTSQAGMLSPDGRCYSFDSRANGFVPGEAVGVLMLKRLADAERDADRILAVLHGWGVNQDGKTNGITAPNEQAQSQLLQSVYRRFGIDPDGIELIEAHGTGTKLGDPIEVAGLKTAFEPFTQRAGYCALGSVKSNIGHCLTAAGAAGIIKLVQALRHRQLPPTLHYRVCNEHIQLDGSPFYVNDRLRPWAVDAGRERRAAISAFGFSGTNAHIVLGEYIERDGACARTHPPDVVLDRAGRMAIPLSARSGAQLRHKARDLLAFVRAGQDERNAYPQHEMPDLVEIAYTLQVGRDAMEERVAFLAASTDELAERLDAYLSAADAHEALPDGVHGLHGIYAGQLRAHRDSIRLLSDDAEIGQTLIGKWLEQRRLDRLLDLWVKGFDFDWNLLYGDAKPRLIALPNYPFATERYWLPRAPVQRGVLHPLVHRNVSVLSRQRYQSRFYGDEFCCDLRLVDAVVLAPGALLEMVRCAVADATTDLGPHHAVSLRDVRWMQAARCTVPAGGSLEITLDLAARDDGGIRFDLLGAHGGGAAAQPLAHGAAWLRDDDQTPQQFTPATLRARCPREPLSAGGADGIYARLARAGLAVGPALRVLDTLSFGEGECFASFDARMDEQDAARGCVLPPGIVDAAWQAGSLAALDDGAALGLMLPDQLEIFTLPVAERAPIRYAWVRRQTSAALALDIDLLDAQGVVVAALRGLTLTPVTAAQAEIAPAETAATPDTALALAAPVWDELPAAPAASRDVSADAGARVLVLGASAQHAAALSLCLPQAVFADVDMQAPVAELLARTTFDRLVWVVSADERLDELRFDLTGEAIIAAQSRGVMFALRIAQALVEAGFENRPLAWDWITFGSIAVRRGEAADPTHAGLHGLCGSLAQTYPHWALRLCDLPALSDAALAVLGTPPAAANGACYAWRDGEWFGQRLVGVRAPVADVRALSPYRTDGVYVVIGGAGGLGGVWTRHVLATCHAHVVWIGRRPLDAAVSAQLDRASVQGRRPEYLQADASDRAALEHAYQQIKRRHGAIHGIVHAAVGAFDQSLKTVCEADFRAVLAAKLDVSVRLAQVFAPEVLDFALFFSSNASFVRGAGMAAYSAGCAFKDAFALQLDRVWRGAAKVVNWGYWNVGAGDAISDAMKRFFDVSGYRPIEPEEGMRALDALLASPLQQLSISRLAPGAAGRLADGSEWLSVQASRSASADWPPLAALARLPVPAAFDALRTRAGQPMEPLLARLLGAMVAATDRPAPAFARWLAESRRIIAAHADAGAPGDMTDLDAAWRAWDAALPGWLRDSGQCALVRLVDRCVRALPDILRGACKATDVIFPDASLEQVEQVYKTDAHSLAFNAALQQALVAALRARIEADPGARLRLIEIGAGTGATTAGILARLDAYRAHIDEYCYTDISKAFLFHAEQAYAPRAPFLRTQLFDVEQPLAAQRIDVGGYDFVIAANVLHATRDVRHALRNAKALLCRGGMLLMNEISRHSVCAHVTFGLLEGWWRNEDEVLRIPGSPGLEPDVWRRVLDAEGFSPVLMLHPDTHAAGQQIVVAISDGIVRQRAASARSPVATTAEALPPVDRREQPMASPDEIDDTRLRDVAVRLCAQLFARAMKLDVDQVDPFEPLERYGFDSIVVSLVNQQLRQYFVDIDSTLLFECRTIDALAGHLLRTQRGTLVRVAGAASQQPSPAISAERERERAASASAAVPRIVPVTARAALPATSATSATSAVRRGALREPIAIIGISGVYPDALNLDAFWHNLQAGRNSIREVPARRWPLDGFYEADEQRAVDEGLSYCKWGGFVDSFAEFDCLFFGIPPREALNMDPQERLFLQAAWHALEDAGYTRAALRDACARRVGIFAGITRAGYQLHRPPAGDAAKFRPRMSFASVANRLSYFLDVTGPSLPVDTMCSSSLTAIHEACEHIHHGECDLALAGGVNLHLHPSGYVDMSSQHMLAPDGRCKSFGVGANGFVPGEGVGVVLLRPLASALEHGDPIHGVILATQLNHGGRTNGYTVPNPVAQAELVRAALDKAGIDARDVSYIEAHGTGTELGDPIEIAGLKQAFSHDTEDTGFCAIGSVKSNIGHLEAAAGIAALTKVLLQFRHGQIAPSLHAETVNPHIRFDETPFRVNQTLCEWTPPIVDSGVRPRIAGISSFGAGGANAHVIVAEHRVAHPPSVCTDSGPVIVPLSARTAGQLRRRAADLLAYLRAHRGEADLIALAYTLQVGREAMEERLACVAAGADALAAQLAAYADDERLAQGVFRGCARHAGAALGAEPQAFAPEQYEQLAEQWVQGTDIDWRRLYRSGVRPRRIGLPGYPFAKDEYWPEAASASPAAAYASASTSASTTATAAALDLAQLEAVLTQIDRAEIDVGDAARRIRRLV